MILARGTFTGRGGHILRGTFTLSRSDDGVTMETSDDFFFDGSSDPGWALFNGVPMTTRSPGVAEAANLTRFGRLAPLTRFPHVEVCGPQRVVIMDRVDLEAYRAVFLWCYEHPFLLGVGPYELVA